MGLHADVRLRQQLEHLVAMAQAEAHDCLCQEVHAILCKLGTSGMKRGKLDQHIYDDIDARIFVAQNELTCNSWVSARKTRCLGAALLLPATPMISTACMVACAGKARNSPAWLSCRSVLFLMCLLL